MTEPTLNDAQREGIRRLREAAYSLAAQCDDEMDRIAADGITPNTAVVALSCSVSRYGPETAGDLHGIISWVRQEWPDDDMPTDARRLLDDSTALLRWVDGKP